MAIMNSVNFSQSGYPSVEFQEIIFEYDDSLSAPGNGDAVIVPSDILGIACTLKTSGGQGKIQATTDLIATVLAGTATWVDWQAGAVTSTTQDYCLPCTAIRQVNISGTTAMTLCAR